LSIFSETGLRTSTLSEYPGDLLSPVFDNVDLYYTKTLTLPPHQVLCRALSLFSAEGIGSCNALDLGCGSGRDTVEILKQGWRVLAIDSEKLAIDYLSARKDLLNPENLTTNLLRLEEFSSVPVELVNAALALPFCPPEAFPKVWQNVLESLSSGGRFSGHFFGDRDTWAAHPMQSHHTRGAVLSLLGAFEIEHLEEIEDDDPALDGEVKHWHVFHVVARKI
jgi:tellurite methyltransferase